MKLIIGALGEIVGSTTGTVEFVVSCNNEGAFTYAQFANNESPILMALGDVEEKFDWQY